MNAPLHQDNLSKQSLESTHRDCSVETSQLRHFCDTDRWRASSDVSRQHCPVEPGAVSTVLMQEIGVLRCVHTGKTTQHLVPFTAILTCTRSIALLLGVLQSQWRRWICLQGYKQQQLMRFWQHQHRQLSTRVLMPRTLIHVTLNSSRYETAAHASLSFTR